MFLQRIFPKLTKKCNTVSFHVSLIGATGDIGQTVGLLLRTQPHITKLTIYDDQTENAGVAMDLSHIPSGAKLQVYSGNDKLEEALKNADIVIATFGSFHQPVIAKKTWIEKNSNFIKELSTRLAKISPMPIIGIATEPINTFIPMAAELMKNHGEYDPKKLFGITSVDLIRAQSLYAIENHIDINKCMVPVIGGHTAKTIVPLLSQAKPACEMKERHIHELTEKIRTSEDSIIKAKTGWSSSLSVAYGILIFTQNILASLKGKDSQIHAYIENNDFGTSFFSGLVHVDNNGVKEMQRYSALSKYECSLLEKSIEELRKDVILGKRILELA